MRRFIIATMILLPCMAVAQVVPTIPKTLEVSVSPEAPGPGDTVTLRAQNYSENKDVTYVWTVNGRITDQGIGRSAITVTAGPLGSETDVTVSATNGADDLGSASVTIRPAGVDIIWEADTAVPPFTGVLPLPNGGSKITFVAMPSLVSGGRTVPPEKATYTWRVNGSQSVALSGYGKNVFVASPPRFENPFSVSVEVATLDGNVQAAGSVVIQPVTPHILVYEVASLLGTRFDRAIGDSFSISDQGTFEAFPLYAAPEDLSYAWTVNGDPAPATSGDPRMITLRKTGTGSGQYSIQASFANASRMFEQAEKAFEITF